MEAEMHSKLISMDCDNMESRQTWQDVPMEHYRAWMQVFNPHPHQHLLTEACPICGSQTLVQYYHLAGLNKRADCPPDILGSGSLWQWCFTCRHYQHYSALISRQWVQPFAIPNEAITVDPDGIERVRVAALPK